MDKIRFMLDANVIIDTLNNDLDLLAFLETLPDCEIYINPVVAIEVLARAGMNEDEESAARARWIRSSGRKLTRPSAKLLSKFAEPKNCVFPMP